MAILSFAYSSVKNSSRYSQLHRYITLSSKAPEDLIMTRGFPDGMWLTGINVLRLCHQKPKGGGIYHLVLAFEDEDNPDKEKIKRITGKVLKNFDDRLCVAAFHDNTQHKHIHVLISSTLVSSGKEKGFTKADLKGIKKACSEILSEEGCRKVRYHDSDIATIDDSVVLTDCDDDIEQLEIPDKEFVSPGDIIMSDVADDADSQSRNSERKSGNSNNSGKYQPQPRSQNIVNNHYYYGATYVDQRKEYSSAMAQYTPQFPQQSPQHEKQQLFNNHYCGNPYFNYGNDYRGCDNSYAQGGYALPSYDYSALPTHAPDVAQHPALTQSYDVTVDYPDVSTDGSHSKVAEPINPFVIIGYVVYVVEISRTTPPLSYDKAIETANYFRRVGYTVLIYETKNDVISPCPTEL